MAALNALRAVQTFDDKKRGTLDAMAYSASVGVTTNADMGAFNLPGTPDLQGSFEADTLASANQFRMYDAVVALHREGKMTTRLRVFFLTMDTRPDVPILSERLRNDFNGFGDDMMRISGIGEFASSWPLFGNKPPDNYQAALSRIAQGGLGVPAAQPLAGRERADGEHVRNGQQDHADRQPALVARARRNRRCGRRSTGSRRWAPAIAVHPFQFLAGGRGGPPLRTIVDSGIKVGAGSDSAQISTLNPWLVISYMVTGKALGRHR